jgi:hypothetical protein
MRFRSEPVVWCHAERSSASNPVRNLDRANRPAGAIYAAHGRFAGRAQVTQGAVDAAALGVDPEISTNV